jgi:hypothetical protein
MYSAVKLRITRVIARRWRWVIRIVQGRNERDPKGHISHPQSSLLIPVHLFWLLNVAPAISRVQPERQSKRGQRSGLEYSTRNATHPVRPARHGPLCHEDAKCVYSITLTHRLFLARQQVLYASVSLGFICLRYMLANFVRNCSFCSFTQRLFWLSSQFFMPQYPLIMLHSRQFVLWNALIGTRTPFRLVIISLMRRGRASAEEGYGLQFFALKC